MLKLHIKIKVRILQHDLSTFDQTLPLPDAVALALSVGHVGAQSLFNDHGVLIELVS